MQSEACTKLFAGSWPLSSEFFLFYWRSYRALWSEAKSRDGDFYARLTHRCLKQSETGWAAKPMGLEQQGYVPKDSASIRHIKVLVLIFLSYLYSSQSTTHLMTCCPMPVQCTEL